MNFTKETCPVCNQATKQFKRINKCSQSSHIYFVDDLDFVAIVYYTISFHGWRHKDDGRIKMNNHYRFMMINSDNFEESKK